MKEEITIECTRDRSVLKTVRRFDEWQVLFRIGNLLLVDGHDFYLLRCY
jgi:hypothetical protein